MGSRELKSRLHRSFGNRVYVKKMKVPPRDRTELSSIASTIRPLKRGQLPSYVSNYRGAPPAAGFTPNRESVITIVGEVTLIIVRLGGRTKRVDEYLVPHR